MRAVVLFYFVFVFMAIVGWVLNLIQVVTNKTPIAEQSAYFVVKVIGIFFAPVGCVLGWVG